MPISVELAHLGPGVQRNAVALLENVTKTYVMGAAEVPHPSPA